MTDTENLTLLAYDVLPEDILVSHVEGAEVLSNDTDALRTRLHVLAPSGDVVTFTISRWADVVIRVQNVT